MIERKHIEISEQERVNWLRLFRSENVGPITFSNLINFYGSATIALSHLNDLAERGGAKRTIKVETEGNIQKELAATTKYGARIILSIDTDYPQRLLQIPDHPPAIIVKGSTEMLNRIQFGIVGSRNASSNSCRLAEQFASSIGKSGYIITSGLARGIDRHAHSAAIESGTVAVIAGGIDHIYPKENTSLYHQICEKGLIVTEAPIGSAPLATHFPKRNRIISGMSIGILIVEAAIKSGSLITARLALDQGREVFAIPGSPLDPRCRGSNSLIKQGASLVQSAEDIIAELSNLGNRANDILFDKYDDYTLPKIEVLVKLPTSTELALYRREVLKQLSYEPVSINDIINRTNIPVRIINLIITELELAGKAERIYSNSVQLIKE